MSIVFNCGGCGHRFRVDTGMGGKRFRCKQCNLVATVPEGVGVSKAAAPGFDPFGLGETPAPRARRSDDGDGLLGEPLVEVTYRPSPVGTAVDGEVNPMRGVPVVHRKRRGSIEAPVLGVPVEHAPWAFLAALVLLDPLCVVFGLGFTRWGVVVALAGLGLNLVVSGSILATTLRLGFFGVIGFLGVELAVYTGLSVFLYSLLLNLGAGHP